MEMSETIGALADALAKAQSDIQGALKDSTNPHFRSKYADLASVWDAWQRVGPAQGLSVSQWPGACENGVMVLTTLLAHKSGEWMRETLTIPLGKVDAQGYGSATTYARRYALAAMAGIAPEDDDGNAASAAKPKPKREKMEGPFDNVTALKGAVRRFTALMAECGDDDTLEGVIADNGEMLAQLRRYVPDWWHGSEEIERSVQDIIRNERARINQLVADNVPIDPGDNEVPESVLMLRASLTACKDIPAVKAWKAENAVLIADVGEPWSSQLESEWVMKGRALRAASDKKD